MATQGLFRTKYRTAASSGPSAMYSADRNSSAAQHFPQYDTHSDGLSHMNAVPACSGVIAHHQWMPKPLYYTASVHTTL